MIATNLFAYYGVFEQALALRNIECMLREGGFLLSNNALPELTFSGLKRSGNLTVVYSDRERFGDNVFWYQRMPGNQPESNWGGNEIIMP
jgi:hypothetical protein